MSAYQLFDRTLFSSFLTTRFVGRILNYLPEGCSSTMDIASGLLEQQGKAVPPGTLILSESQSGGRGRIAGRSWASPALGNLYFTLIVRPPSLQALALTNLAAAVAVTGACRQLGVEDAQIKWPNDVWVRSRKVAGVLVDSVAVGSEFVAKIGVGVNVNQRFEGLDLEMDPMPTSVAQCLDREVRREELLAAFCNQMEALLAMEPLPLVSRYKALELLHKQASLVVMPKRKEAPERIIATPVGISDQGYLIVQYPDLSIVQLVAEEASVRPNSPL